MCHWNNGCIITPILDMYFANTILFRELMMNKKHESTFLPDLLSMFYLESLGPEHRMVRGPIEIVRILIIQAKEGAF